MKHRYKLMSLVVSTGLFLGACGDGGEDTGDSAEEPAEETDSGTAEDTTDSEAEDDPADTTDETDDGGTAEEAESEGDTPEENDDTIAVEDISHEPGEAVEAAMENFDGELVELELDDENGTWVYDVHLENDTEEYEAVLSADDLSVVSEESEQDDDNDSEDRFNYEDAISYEDAVQTAIDETGGDFAEFTLDMDDGGLEYEIELENTDEGEDADVTINAESGEVIESDD